MSNKNTSNLQQNNNIIPTQQLYKLQQEMPMKS